MKSPADPYRIILADDHDILRFGLRSLLERQGEFKVVAEARDGRELMDLLDTTPCDLVVLDLSMPELDGLKVLELIGKGPRVPRILIFSMHKEREFFRTALARGVDGYILKDDDLEKIPIAIRDIRAGRKYYSPELTSFIVNEYQVIQDSAISLELLTRRELEILKLIARGMTNREVAENLDISHRTVQTHRSNIMEKLEIKNTAGLVKFAISHGLA